MRATWKWCICWQALLLFDKREVDASQVTTIPKQSLSVIGGDWTYTPAQGNEKLGQFLYSSPMGKNCSRTLTVHFHGSLCTVQGGQVNQRFIDDLLCVPQGLEVPAKMVDVLNSKPEFLNDTCLQISANQYNTDVMRNQLMGHWTTDLQEATKKGPIKHGLIGYDLDTSIARSAVEMRLLHVNIGDSPGVETDFSITSDYYTSFHVKPSQSVLLPGIFKRLLPQRFAVVYDDAQAASFSKAMRESAVKHNKDVALEVTVPESSASFEGDAIMRSFLKEMISKQLRYVFIFSAVKTFPAMMLCAAYRTGLSDFVQIVSIVPPSLLYWRWFMTECQGEPGILTKVGENSGFVGVYSAYSTDVSSDTSINLVTGSQGNTEPGDLDIIGPWVDNSFNVVDSPACFDSPDINNSVILRRLLDKSPGDTLTCAEAVLQGQSEYWAWMKDVAEYCPISSCNFNSEAEACRISCACTNSSLVHPLGGPWCVTYETVPKNLGRYKRKRCSGLSCRPVMTGDNASGAPGNLFMPWGYAPEPHRGFCPGENYTCPMGAFYPIFVFGYPYSDGLWSLALAYHCIEKRHGDSGLDRLVNHDYMDDWLAAELVSCMETEVQFQGLGGFVNFTHNHGPPPGTSVQMLMEFHSTITENLITGFFQADDLLVYHRTFWRSNYSLCSGMKNYLVPGLDCPNGTSLEYRMEWGNDADVPSGFPASCPAGQYPLPFGESSSPSHADVFRCVACPPGTFKASVGDELCSPCAPGWASEVGADSCFLCGKNMRSADVAVPSKLLLDGRSQYYGAASCVSCLDGEVSMPGAARCEICSPGLYGPEEWRPANSSDTPPTDPLGCRMCEPGTFQWQARQTACIPCGSVLSGSSSPRGSTNSSECGCPEGRYYKPSVSGLKPACLECPEGMECPGLLLQPVQAPGYWAEVVDANLREFAVKKCRDKFECPGGAEAGQEGSCAPGRWQIACESCKPNHRKGDYGECVLCSEENLLPILVLVLVFPFGVLVAMLFVKVDFARQHLTGLTVVITGGQLVGALQALTAIRSLSIKWSEPVKSFLDLLSVLSLDLDVLQVTCVMPSDDPITKYVGQLLLFPMLAGVILLSYLVCKLVGRPVMLDTIINLAGAALMVLYISVTIMVLDPWQCVPNPDGTTSIATNPGIVCWTTPEHQSMVALSVVGILCYPVAFLTWTGWTISTYTKRIQAGAGMALVRRYRFLFNRFKAERYYYGIVLLGRNTLIALAPVVLVNYSVVQVMVMGAILQFSLAVQARLWPWRTDSSNYSDLAIAMILVVLLLAASPLLEMPEEEKVYTLGMVMFVLVIVSLLSGLAVAVHACYRRLRPPDRFSMFLCHHKGGAGALARYVKMRCRAYIRSPIFLDSDNLDELDLIFDVIRSQTRNLVVLLSPELLMRMWCAGEIATAFANKVPFVPVACDSYTPPDDASIEAIPDCWSDEQKHTLGNLGVTVELIKVAYKALREVPTLSLARFCTASEKEEAIVKLIATCKCGSFKPIPISGTGTARILIAGNLSEGEVRSGCEILQMLIQRHTQVEVSLLEDQDDLSLQDVLDNAFYLVTVLSTGVLKDGSFGNLLTKICQDDGHPEFVTVNLDNSFTFPSMEFYTELQKSGQPDLSKALKELLGILSLPFSALGSEGLQLKQVSEISRRFKRYQKGVTENMVEADEAQVAIKKKESVKRLESLRLTRGTQENAKTDRPEFSEDSDELVAMPHVDEDLGIDEDLQLEQF